MQSLKNLQARLKKHARKFSTVAEFLRFLQNVSEIHRTTIWRWLNAKEADRSTCVRMTALLDQLDGRKPKQLSPRTNRFHRETLQSMEHQIVDLRKKLLEMKNQINLMLMAFE